ncbi:MULTISPECIES: flagellar protein FlgN [Luteimonas]|uniref:Flagellar protein FlgN n=1 Tax=Luteimonas chenhongjianii TaxID=2006110 RepID=A0A290XEX9_9GAMM|nr:MULTISPECIES: flagellar protein FlgN [Luteimonas]ATD67695.1 flagellar protein FlgN [Luteimonas chenhongjianii]RPD88643.1 flagellar protein FlgN [Luteimonas sp. 100069]
MSDPQASLERLAAALSAEREALIGHDVDALMRSTRDKIVALRELETYPSGELSGPLAELAEFNRANGALLARRRREVNWALRHLGRMESAPAYDASGRAETARRPRELAVA